MLPKSARRRKTFLSGCNVFLITFFRSRKSGAAARSAIPRRLFEKRKKNHFFFAQAFLHPPAFLAGTDFFAEAGFVTTFFAGAAFFAGAGFATTFFAGAGFFAAAFLAGATFFATGFFAEAAFFAAGFFAGTAFLAGAFFAGAFLTAGFFVVFAVAMVFLTGCFNEISSSIAACAAARRAVGTRYGEQLT